MIHVQVDPWSRPSPLPASREMLTLPNALVQSLAVLVCIAVLTPLAWASPITIENHTDTSEEFIAFVTSGPAFHPDAHVWPVPDTPDTPWESSSLVFEYSPSLDTVMGVSVSWDIRHLRGPHGEDIDPQPDPPTHLETSPLFPPPIPGFYTTYQNASRTHPTDDAQVSHLDEFYLFVGITVGPDFPFRPISYTITYSAHHVPEPTSLALLGSAILMIGGVRFLRWRRGASRSRLAG